MLVTMVGAPLVSSGEPIEDTSRILEEITTSEPRDYPNGWTHRPVVEVFTSLSCSPCMSNSEPQVIAMHEALQADNSQPYTIVTFHHTNGGDGDDELDGSDGNDTITGGAGDDTLFAGIGTNSLNGGDGDDIIFTENDTSSRNTIEGGSGNDTINAGSGADRIIAGAGNDTYKFGLGIDEIDYSAIVFWFL